MGSPLSASNVANAASLPLSDAARAASNQEPKAARVSDGLSVPPASNGRYCQILGSRAASKRPFL
jgi:hypothetical protein